MSQTLHERLHRALGAQEIENIKTRHAYLHAKSHSYEEWSELWDHMLVFRGFCVLCQDLMPLNLPNDGQAMDIALTCFQFCTAKLYGLFPLFLQFIGLLLFF